MPTELQDPERTMVEFIDAPVRTCSAGMKGRLGFSVAVHVDPDVLLADEVLTVGDAAFRAKAGSILDRFRRSGKTVIIATHSIALVRQQCARAIWLETGAIRMGGAPGDVCSAYQRDYGQRKPNRAGRRKGVEAE